MFFGIPQAYTIDIYGFYFEKHMLGYLIAVMPPPATGLTGTGTSGGIFALLG